MLQFLEKAFPPADKETIETSVMLARLGAPFGFGCLAAAVHGITCSRQLKGIDRSFLATLIVLPVMIALVTIAIGDNVARAFSLVGTLAIVRFRTVVEDTRDTTFVIYAVAGGLCAGTGYLLGPLACAPLVFIATWVFGPRNEPAPSATGGGEALLVLRLAATGSIEERVAALLKQHVGDHRLVGLATARGGAALDATYAVRMPAPDKVMGLIKTLGTLEGVQGVELKAS